MTAAHWDTVMAVHDGELQSAGGEVRRLPVARWLGHEHADESLLGAVLDWCHGPTVDLGCGPGRIVDLLLRRGIPALGVDDSPHAVRLTRERGAAALRRDVFAPLPGEGRWSHAILLDGNIGIGGDPARLLRRAAALVEPGGTVVVEVEPSARGVHREAVRVRSAGGTSVWFPWAHVGFDVLDDLAVDAGLRLARRLDHSGRRCAELVR
ncbi:class I SAM-dependent methyltransferase [Tsukamurella sp. NPDC003166]|uniref:class I SAM-dependent methyltransferase n=1 Tax=Tsukamurella sp. NPDC003166 TaxID=3154444 RepID=UPI0033A8091B